MEELPEIELKVVKERAIKGVVALSGRTFIVQIISFVGFFLLTIFLGRADIGLFFAVSELIGILGYFSDVGLAAALIQKEEQPEVEDIRSTFTLQQILVVTLVVGAFLFTKPIAAFYQISQSGILLFWSLTLGFFFASLKTIPSVLLERHLRFDRLALVEIVENFIFYGIAVILSWRGFGILSYAYAVILRGVVGILLIYRLSPWPVGFSLKSNSLRHLLKFGVPYQANTFLAVVKDRMMNVVLWKIIGAEGVGIIGWAQKWSQIPLRFIMDAVMKVTFPAYSRMQQDPKELSRSIEKTILFLSLLIFPMLIYMSVLGRSLIEIIPQYRKWEIGLVPLYLLVINSAWGAVTTPLTNALSAIGKIKTVFKLMLMWTALTWLFYPLLAIKFGYLGVAMASVLVSTSSVVAIWATKRVIDFKFWTSIYKPLLASIATGLFLFLCLPLIKGNFIVFLIVCFFGLIFYTASIFFLLGKGIFLEIQKIIYVFKNQN